MREQWVFERQRNSFWTGRRGVPRSPMEALVMRLITWHDKTLRAKARELGVDLSACATKEQRIVAVAHGILSRT